MLKVYAYSPIQGQKVDPCLMFQNQNNLSCIVQSLPELILIVGILVIVSFGILTLVRKLFSKKRK